MFTTFFSTATNEVNWVMILNSSANWMMSSLVTLDASGYAEAKKFLRVNSSTRCRAQIDSSAGAFA